MMEEQVEVFPPNAVTAVVWPWRERLDPPPVLPPPSTVRPCLIQFMVLIIVGLIVRYGIGHPRVAYLPFGMASLILVTGLFFPPAFRKIEGFGLRLGQWVGIIMTWVLLTPFFYICFIPGRIFGAVTGRDPMTRGFPTDEKTYWIDRSKVESPRHFERQY